MTTFLLAIASILMSVVAQFALRAGVQTWRAAASADVPATQQLLAAATNPWISIGFALYGLSAIVWLGVLSRWEVSKAYPLVGVGFILTAVVGYWIGESVGPMRIAGILLIAGGVALVASS